MPGKATFPGSKPSGDLIRRRPQLFGQLIRELKAAQAEQAPTPDGFSEEQAEQLQALSSAELVQLAEMTEPRVAIQIDAGSLEHGLRQVG